MSSIGHVRDDVTKQRDQSGTRLSYDSLEETAHLLRVPANARRLIESLQQAVSGQRDEHDLVE